MATRQPVKSISISRWLKTLVILFNLGFASILPASLSAQWIQLPTVSQESSSLVNQFLISDWIRDSATNSSKSKKAFEEKKTSSSEILFAFLLNRIQHNENREALQVVEQMTAANPDTLDGWLIKAHLNALLDNFDRALIDLRSAKKLLVNNPNWNIEQKLESYRRMGRLVGYLQGPAAEKLNPDTLAAASQAIGDGCTAEELAAYDDGRNRVLQRFEKSLKAENDKIQAELEKQAIENESLDESLTGQNEFLGKTTDQLLAEQARLRTEGTQRLADLTTLASPLESRLASLTTQVNAVRYDLQLLYTDLYYAENAPPRYQSSTWFLRDQIRGAEISFANLQANANATANQLQGVRVQYNQTRNGYDNRIAQLQLQVERLNGTRLRNQKKLAKIAAGPELAAGKKQGIASRLEALTSYIELPIELYRQQLLDAIEKK